jgi:hypothetical protein
MNLAKLGFQATLFTGLAVGLTAVITPEANAFSIGDDLNIFGDARFEITGDSGLLNFDDNVGTGINYATATGKGEVGSSASPVFVPGSTVFLKDLSLTNTGVDQWSLVGDVDDFLSFDSTSIKYSLTSFVLAKVFDGIIPVWVANFDGFFTDGATFSGVGVFSTQGNFVATSQFPRGTTYSGTVVAVPTPALLPGLLGLGVAALRRKNDTVSEENA